MNYARIYAELIARRRAIPADGYTERHHIVPRALGGSDDTANVVRLTAREHFIAHCLLAKIHGGTMWVAIVRMKGKRQRYTNGRLYAAARRRWSSFLSGDVQRGPNNHAFGKPLSPEHAAKVSAAMSARRLSAEHRKKIGAAHRGRIVSAETRAKQSATRKAMFAAGAKNAMLGKKRPDLAARNRANAKLGRK